jgi:hypothetical protein
MYLGFLGLFMFVYSANNDTSNNNTSNNNPQNIREKPPNKYSNEYFIDITNKNNVFWQYSDENFMLIEFLKVPLANYGTNNCVSEFLKGEKSPANAQNNDQQGDEHHKKLLKIIDSVSDESVIEDILNSCWHIFSVSGLHQSLRLFPGC